MYGGRSMSKKDMKAEIIDILINEYGMSAANAERQYMNWEIFADKVDNPKIFAEMINYYLFR